MCVGVRIFFWYAHNPCHLTVITCMSRSGKNLIHPRPHLPITAEHVFSELDEVLKAIRTILLVQLKDNIFDKLKNKTTLDLKEDRANKLMAFRQINS